MKPIEEICRLMVEHVRQQRALGYNIETMVWHCPSGSDIEQRLMKHLNVPPYPRKTFDERLTKALFEKYPL